MITPDRAAVAGLACPLLIGLFIAYAARRRYGYDPWRDTITSLGDGVDDVALGFLFVNMIVGVGLAVFGRYAAPLVTVHWISWPLYVAAGGSFLIGWTPGRDHCVVPYRYGRPWDFVPKLHRLTATAIVVVMVMLPVFTLYKADRQLRTACVVFLGAFALAAVGVPWRWSRVRRRLTLASVVPLTPNRRSLFYQYGGLLERIGWGIGYGWVVAVAVNELHRQWTLWATLAWLVLAAIGILWPRGVVPLDRFDIEECQQNLVYGLSGATRGVFAFFTILDPQKFRDDLRTALDEFSIVGERRRGRNPARHPARRAHTLTLGLTHSGVTKLGHYGWMGPPRESPAEPAGRSVGTRVSRDDPFAAGMRARGALLGDRGDDWLGEWQEIDGVLWSYQRERAWKISKIFAGWSGGGVKWRFHIRTERVGEEAGLLGFADGISQPWVQGIPVPSVIPGAEKDREPRGGGKIGEREAWRPLALGEFVLGQVDEANDVFPVPDPAPLFLGGTFAAIRQLSVDNEAFKELRCSLDQQWMTLCAGSVPRGVPDPVTRLVGRQPDGAPAYDLTKPRLNTFRFGNDPFGLVCPHASHIRRSNPRDSLGFDGVLANRRRIIRRGMPYVGSLRVGRPTDKPSDEEGPRGLMFVALNARLSDQFEFVQSQWLNTGTAFGLGQDPDVTSGSWTDGTRQVVIPTPVGPLMYELRNPISRAVGGDYFFFPSFRGLEYLTRTPAESGG
jgi:deferrochelatase/peroxidase EfeB